ncbi:hypothetical protein [Methanopyrus sp. KOL6]|uniref:hypothetical protein n=1 Tax=Methanopyrus sp. KOL6 TaxID=1937004 RepID=UPI0018E007DC|nr:hypothetical protein [Methanopyrus sp. KOL6]
MLRSLREAMETLRRHVRVLEVVVEHQPIGIGRIADVTGMEWHKVRYSLRVLEEEGIIRPSKRGAVLTEDAPARISEISRRLSELNREFEDISKRYQSLARKLEEG